MGRPVVHFEIGCRDKARTAEFFSKLFDWNTQEMGPATIIDTGCRLGHQWAHHLARPRTAQLRNHLHRSGRRAGLSR